MKASRFKGILFRAAALGAGFLLLFLSLELVFLFLPVDDGLVTVPVTRENPVLHFVPNRDSTWSRGWRFNLVNQVHTNNEGFVHDHDYDPHGTTPLLAVIGDSYVEAAMVPFPETGAGRLWEAAAGAARVYAFASSGSPLSQYLAYSEYARDRFHPDGLVVVAVGNDFDESLLRPGAPAGFHYFRRDADGRLDPSLELVEFRPGLLRRLARRSSLARYFVTNLELPALPARLRAKLTRKGNAYTGNTAREASEERVAASLDAIDAFLARLPEASGLPPERILLVLDGIRPELYDPPSLENARRSYFGVMRRALLSRAAAARFQVADMQPLFQADYRARGKRFEFPGNAHWNAEGHRVFAEAVIASPVWTGLFSDKGEQP